MWRRTPCQDGKETENGGDGGQRTAGQSRSPRVAKWNLHGHLSVYVTGMTDKLTVIYNAECPICSREIEAYASYSDRAGLPIRFDPLNEAELDRWGLTPEAAAKRLHVVQDGRLIAGTDAFLALWSAMPRFRWLARILGARPVKPVVNAAYEYVAAPALYALHRRRVRRGKAAAAG